MKQGRGEVDEPLTTKNTKPAKTRKRSVSSPTQPEHLNTSVLPEMMIECEGSLDAAGVEQGKRNRLAQARVVVGVLSQNLSGALLFGGERAQDRLPARQEAMATCQFSEFGPGELV